MPQYPHLQLLPRLHAIRELGFAVEYFPRYVNRVFSPHSLDVVLMTVIIRGRGRHVMGQTAYQERSGSVGITHYGQVHDVLTDRRGMDIYNVYLDLRDHPLPVMPAALQDVVPAILPLHPQFRNRLNRSVHFQVRQPQRLAELLRRIECELRERQPGYEDVARSCFRVFLVECCREAMRGGIEFTRPVDGRFPLWLERMRLRLDQTYASNVSLERLAGDARVSEGHLCRLFKAYTGKTVFQYLIERRIQAAMFRLRSGREKILAVAMESGFSDVAYFNRTFKRMVGRTPRAYRLAGADTPPESLTSA
jgi:AraC-like DNA-binding protein